MVFWAWIKQRKNRHTVAYSSVSIDGWSRTGDGPKAYHVALLATSERRVGSIELTKEMADQIVAEINKQERV